MKAAGYVEVDTMRRVSEIITMGQLPMMGTSFVDILLDGGTCKFGRMMFSAAAQSSGKTSWAEIATSAFGESIWSGMAPGGESAASGKSPAEFSLALSESESPVSPAMLPYIPSQARGDQSPSYCSSSKEGDYSELVSMWKEKEVSEDTIVSSDTRRSGWTHRKLGLKGGTEGLGSDEAETTKVKFADSED